MPPQIPFNKIIAKESKTKKENTDDFLNNELNDIPNIEQEKQQEYDNKDTVDFFEADLPAKETNEVNNIDGESQKKIAPENHNVAQMVPKQIVQQKKIVIPQLKDEVLAKVEKIMEEGLKDAYKEMTPLQQQEFKIKGEETAIKIKELLKSTRTKIRKIFKLVMDWLRFIPGVNKYYLEQEAKIKTDKIIALKHISNLSRIDD